MLQILRVMVTSAALFIAILMLLFTAYVPGFFSFDNVFGLEIFCNFIFQRMSVFLQRDYKRYIYIVFYFELFNKDSI